MKTRHSTSRFLSHIGPVIFYIVLSLSPGCEKETETIYGPTTGDNSIDPSVKPRVVSTYPTNNGIGPFDVYTPQVNPLAPHFLIQFNKLISTNSLRLGTVHCQGGTRGINVILHGSYPQYTNAVGFELIDSATSSLFFYRIGITYTVTLDTLIYDVNGNHFSQPFTFSFKPEPSVRILNVYPQDHDSLSADATPRILFNTSLTDSGRYHVHLAPTVSGFWNGGYSSEPGTPSSVTFFPYSAFRPESTYSVTVDIGLKDYQGNALPQPFASSFHAGLPPPFLVNYATPANGSTSVILGNFVFVTFSRLIDVSTVSNAVTISPPIGNGYGIWDDGFNSDPAYDLIPDSSYSVTISTAFKALDGTNLEHPYTFSFKTGDFTLSFSSPVNGASGVQRREEIFQNFTGRIDTTTARSAFAISPSVPGQFRFSEPAYQVIFVPDTLLLPNTTYHVTISTSLSNTAGYHLTQPVNYYFSTGW